MGRPMCIAVVDGDGNLKAFIRMDGAPLLAVQLSQDKAYTAISFGMATHDWFEFVKNDPPLLNGIIKTDRLIVFGGGYSITTDAGIIGGIGVSGGGSNKLDKAYQWQYTASVKNICSLSLQHWYSQTLRQYAC